MRKKKGIIAIATVIFLIVSGIYFQNFFGKSRPEKKEIQGNTITKTDEKSTEVFNAEQEQAMKIEQQEERKVLILKDEEVLKNPVFIAFIDNEISTYDSGESEKKYLIDYLNEYHEIYGIHYMAEDLNEDAKNELMVLIQRSSDFGDLLVFEETEDGEFVTWDIWEDFITDRLYEVYYCENATFERVGGSGISIGHYTQKGKQEMLMDYYIGARQYYDDSYDVGSIFLRLYDNGEVVDEIQYERYYDIELGDWILPSENETKKSECDELVSEMLAMLGDRKKIKVQSKEYENKVETILLKELLNP